MFVNYDEAISIMEKIKKETDDIAVFTDHGWGDDPSMETEYTIIRDGDGQNPLAHITQNTFARLREEGLIGPNRLQTFKARTLHYYTPHKNHVDHERHISTKGE